MSDDPAKAANRSDREALATVREVLTKANLDPRPLVDALGYSVEFQDDGPPVDGIAHILDGEDRFVFLLVFRSRAPVQARSQVAEFVTRANYGISIGSFEMDYSDGEVRYRTGVDYSGHKLPPWLIRNSILAAMNSVEVYADALESVIRGESEPAQAIEEAEADFGIN